MCGTTCMEDAAAAVDAGVDGLGFIFFEKSRRNVAPEVARGIIASLPPFVSSVGVFVNRSREEVEELIRYCRLDYAQLHGQEDPKYCERLTRFAAPCKIIKAFRVGPHLQAADIAPYAGYVRGFLLDTYNKGIAGGTGKSFDWSMIDSLQLTRPLILAGGLDIDNVGQAIEAVSPYAIDVNSGVETAPGRKDHGAVQSFVKKVRQLELS